MWTTEHSIETTASPESIWRLWADVATWGEWNADIEQIQISGPFAAGSTIAMTPVGQGTVELRLSEVSEPKLFVDEAVVGDVVITTFHRIDRLDEGRSRVTYRLEIIGPAADTVGPELGPQISGDFAEVLAALVETAGAMDPHAG
jgi:Polyketide cyclase / dehydrase and lipid transport